MKKYIWIGSIGLFITLVFAFSNLSTQNTSFCEGKDWENMTVKQVMNIKKECEKELEFLGQEYDVAAKEYEEAQQKRKAQADSVRELLQSMPIKETIKEDNGVVEVKEETYTSIWRNQDKNPLPKVSGNTKEKRLANILKYFGHDIQDYVKVREQTGIPEELIAAIVWADTGFMNLKSSNNYGNVGNNDRGDVVHFTSRVEGLNAIGRTINNKYLGQNKTIGELSQGGRTILGLPPCEQSGIYCYATSPENWNKNVLDFMTFIHGERINEDFTFRK